LTCKRILQRSFCNKDFVPGENKVPVKRKVFDHDEINHIVEAALDGWFTTGRFNEQFEKQLAKYINVKKGSYCEFRFLANLLALATLMQKSLEKEAIRPGDELITVQCFSTTLNQRCYMEVVPVFVDVDIPTYNMSNEY